MNPAIVLGGASCVWDDLAALEAMVGSPWPWRIYAVNDAGAAFSRPIDGWVTLHPENMEGWQEARRQAGYDMDFVCWGGIWRTGVDNSVHPLIDRVLRVKPMLSRANEDRMGSSGMHAVEVALHEEPDEPVYCCGCPIDARAHFFDDRPWDSPIAHRDAWLDAKDEYLGRVKSMRGWTKEILGAPTAADFRAARP